MVLNGIVIVWICCPSWDHIARIEDECKYQCCSQDQAIRDQDQDQDHTPRDQDQDREVQDQDQKSETKTSNFRDQDQDQDQRLLNWH